MNDAVIEILKAWYLSTFSLAIWTCINLIVNKRGDKAITITISLFVSLLSIPALNGYIYFSQGDTLPILGQLSQNLTLAYGPLLFLVSQFLLLKPVKLTSASLHFLPFVLLNTDKAIGTDLINGYLLVGLIFIQTTGYLIYCMLALKNYQRKIGQIIRHHQNSTYYWLLFLSVGLASLMLVDLSVWTYVITTTNPPNMLALSIFASSISLFISLIALFALFQPRFFDAKPVQSKGANQSEPTKPLRNIELSPEVAEQLDQQLTALVEKEKLYLDESLSLGKLAALLGITRNQLSELFNIHKQVSFYQYFNDLRFEESVNLLKANNQQMSVLDIAYRAGFNNKNSFYKVFKEKAGMTPSEYRKQLSA
ncbi:helix-turn-helix domain-containing protein [Catenovulum sp. SM1970]|uniref:helix-turn-helix domain-containing protein n=1 Tax=Marinifaba aquimaris TaxID=2741323 RepID=UPI001573E9F9|nr:helix-turn-helix domain-containing protein [Marinifaba aquimaris]NTS78742.1 helix-turn-helix domain-containing protein [Marinifaba aquimaris]